METCEICGFESKSKRGLATHKRAKHPEVAPAPKADPAEPKKYICMKKCWHMQRRFQKGQMVNFTDAELPRDENGNVVHFIPADSTSIPTSF